MCKLCDNLIWRAEKCGKGALEKKWRLQRGLQHPYHRLHEGGPQDAPVQHDHLHRERARPRGKNGWPSDEQKAAAVGGAGGGAAAKKRSLEEALGEVRDEFEAKLRKANGDPEAVADAEHV